MSDSPEVLKPLKTWSHLAKNRRRPSEYDITSVRLHTSMNNPDKPWEMDTNLHMNQWYLNYRNKSPLQHEDWDTFRDPDAIVYRTYNIMQDGQETYVKSLLDQFNDREHDKAIDREWVGTLAKLYTPARYVFHALQMSSAYIGQMAPASTITNCSTFQAADSHRWLTHTAYRTYELSLTHPDAGFGQDERKHWEDDEAWQGFRELTERAMTAWDWGESFCAINLVLKPAVEAAVLHQLGEAGRHNSDTLLGMLCDSQCRDSERHMRWSKALVDLALENSENKAVLTSWLDKWMPLGINAVEKYCAELPDSENAINNAKAALEKSRENLGV